MLLSKEITFYLKCIAFPLGSIVGAVVGASIAIIVVLLTIIIILTVKHIRIKHYEEISLM